MKKKPKEQENQTPTKLFMAKPRTDPTSPIQLTEVQLENLKKAAEKCKVAFRFRTPLVMNSPPMIIEGLKILREWTEEDGSIVTEYELPEGADLREMLRPFGHIDPEQNFLKDDDQEYTSEP